MKRTTARIMSAQALAAGVIALTGTGALALAASSGNLPVVGDDNGNHGKPSADASTDPTDGASPTDTADPSADPTTDGPKGTPSPSLKGLCKAFQAGQANGHPKDLTKPSFKALVTAAGDEASVATYCVTLVGEPKPAKVKEPKTDKPAKPAKPEKPAKVEKPKKDKKDKPAKVEKPKKDKAAKPVKPAHPVKPEKPAHPVKPSKTA